MDEVEKVVRRDKSLLPPPEDAPQEVKDAHERIMTVAVWYQNCFMAQVAGSSTWQRQEIRKLFTISEARDGGKECVPVNTEAMSILFFENGMTAEPGDLDKEGNQKIGKWPEYFKLTNGCREKAKVPRSKDADEDAKFEGRYSSSKAGSCTFGGWKDTGLQRFEHWISEIIQIRKKPHCLPVEREILRRSRMQIWNLQGPIGEGDEGRPRAKKTTKKSKVKLSMRM